MKRAILLLIACGLVACEPDDLRVLGIATGGGTAPAPVEQAPGNTITPPPAVMKAQFTEPATERLQKDAMRECVDKAAAYTQSRGRQVVFMNIVRSPLGNWICVFEEY